MSLKEIGHGDEEIGGEGITLSESIAALDPGPWNAVKNDDCSTSDKNVFDLDTETRGNTSVAKQGEK